MINKKMAWIGATVLALGAGSVAVATFASADETNPVHGSNALVSWSIPNAPATGLTNLTFPITVNSATRRVEGTYFAQQFNFTNNNQVGYTGLQPRPDRDGHQRLHAAFSSFIAGTTSSDANCSDGADGGPGVSCASDFDAVYGHEYAITVERTGADTWSGTARDTETGASSHIGTYKLPTSTGNINGQQVGFVEYYLPVPSCDRAQPVDVAFGAPTTTDAGGLTGSTKPDGEYRTESCHGKFKSTTQGDSAQVSRGVRHPAEGRRPQSPAPTGTQPGAPASEPASSAPTTQPPNKQAPATPATPAAPAAPVGGKVGAGNVLVDWSIPNAPASGLSNLTFPITVNSGTRRVEGTYFAQQFNFANAKDVGYTGLQPRADQNGHQRLHAAFSSFIPGTTSSDANCSDGADGGPGVSCASDFDAVYGHKYAITVEQTGADTWSGTARDTETGASSHIGTYKLPSDSGKLKGQQSGFVEYYLPIASCAQMPLVDVAFDAPTSTEAGGLTGSSDAVHEYYGECLGRANYRAADAGSGTHITRGFVPAPDAKPANG